MPPKRIPIGISDFRKLMEEDYYYVDKTLFIREVIQSSSEVLLLPRPRRFGKTLNLSMLRYFFEKSDEDRSPLFKGLAIEKDEIFQTFQGKYPVICMTFKDVKHLNWQHCLSSLKYVVYDEFARHRYLLEKDVLFSEEKIFFNRILDHSLPEERYHSALKYLSMYLYRYYKIPVIILIDEYDTPIHAGYTGGYYEEIISFMRNFLSGGLKDNFHMFRCVMTGILRVAKESVFSGLNNPGVYTLLNKEFSTFFGFTEEEVAQLLHHNNISDRYEDIREWYNGYLFGGKVIYN
ncbi:MAG: AAA family ATPase, partial [Desulfococcaceae bacterium]|nr:AAA family ATPase [Desulfococcaceae bacterium]